MVQLMNPDIIAYNEAQAAGDAAVCSRLADLIDGGLSDAEAKIWHAHPVWFLEGNPIVGYSPQKKGVRLMFWSGADFGEAGLEATTGKFRDASVFYREVSEVRAEDLSRWLRLGREIQWDYKNIVKRKGRLERLA